MQQSLTGKSRYGSLVREGVVPETLRHALDAEWLTYALAQHKAGARVERVESIEVLRTMATKVRFKVEFGSGCGDGAYCLKAFLDVDEGAARGVPVSVIEADFYGELAPQLSMRLAKCVTAIVDREAARGIIIMRDLIEEGAAFCSALRAFQPDEVAQTLEQLARLHAAQALLARTLWIRHQIAMLANSAYVSLPALQELLDGPRGTGLPARTRDAGRLLGAMKSLASLDERGPQVLVHGDCHAGNLFQTSEGLGFVDWQLLQKGGWALDVSYHIAAVLSVEVAESEERSLLDHYLRVRRTLGCDVPSPETAWEEYRRAMTYGYYLWAITRRVDPAITNVFVNRLGSAVTRHESYRLLGVG